MRHIRILFGPTLALLLVGCSAGRPTREDYLAVVAQVVRTLEQDARSQDLGRPPRGPLWVDANGFAGRGTDVTGTRMTADEVMAALGAGVRRADPQQVLLAPEEEDMLGGTWVREYGVHVSPNAARGTRDQITMLAGDYSTDRRAIPTSICERVWRLRYRRQADGSWTPTERTLTRGCLDATQER